MYMYMYLLQSYPYMLCPAFLDHEWPTKFSAAVGHAVNIFTWQVPYNIVNIVNIVYDLLTDL